MNYRVSAQSALDAGSWRLARTAFRVVAEETRTDHLPKAALIAIDTV